MAEIAFLLEKVTCRYGDLEAVRRANLTIAAGEQTAFIGPSGSGKTTLLRVLNTMRAPDSGDVSIFGRRPADASSRELRRLRSEIATIPQHLGLVPNLTAVQNVVLGKGGRRGTARSLRDLLFPSRDDVRSIHAILERVGIEEKLFSRTSQLSGGQQQRVAIARALFQEPTVLIADEPVSSVDPARARDTIRLLCELSRERNFTLCVSLHDVDLAREFFPRIIGMRLGDVVFDGDPQSLTDATLMELYRLSQEEMMRDA